MSEEIINKAKSDIRANQTALGIELGSTRIKAVLTGSDYAPIASGSHEWENKLTNGIWTYSLDDVWAGIQNCFRDLSADVKNRYGETLSEVGAIGVSAMMHGYLAFDKNEKQLAEFRTWRNTSTETAAEKLSAEFDLNIPQRWSIAHLYQAILNKEEHVGDIAFLTTLAGYVHWRLTDKKVIGIGDASGMFPVDRNGQYNSVMICRFGKIAAERGFKQELKAILPEILNAGEPAGTLTENGASLLDPSGALKAGIPFCPPEGDAGTGMAATNSTRAKTGNVSAGTSIFAMIVLEKEMCNYYPEIDIVTTPDGKPVAMVHCNNCTSDLDAWIKLFSEAVNVFGLTPEKSEIYELLYKKSLEAAPDCGGLLSYNYISGESVAGLNEGRPLFARKPDSHFSLANFMRTLIYSSFAALKIGMEILEKENVILEKLTGHGGLFKTPHVAQILMASALNVPVSVTETAGEGGAWGIALLTSYMKNNNKNKKTLDEFLSQDVFKNYAGITAEPVSADTQGFNTFMERYKCGLAIEKSAAENLYS